MCSWYSLYSTNLDLFLHYISPTSRDTHVPIFHYILNVEHIGYEVGRCNCLQTTNFLSLEVPNSPPFYSASSADSNSAIIIPLCPTKLLRKTRRTIQENRLNCLLNTAAYGNVLPRAYNPRAVWPIGVRSRRGGSELAIVGCHDCSGGSCWVER